MVTLCSLEREFQEALKGRSAIQNLIEEELSKEGRWLPSLATRLREGLDSLDATARRVAPQPGSRGVENVQEPTGRKVHTKTLSTIQYDRFPFAKACFISKVLSTCTVIMMSVP